MASVIRTKKGFDLPILGEASKTILEASSNRYAVKPTDFFGIAPIPKMEVSPGERVLAGDPLFFDKRQPDIHFTAPVSGTLVEIRRGPKRAIHEVIIDADDTIEYRQMDPANPSSLTREQIVVTLLKSGAWPSIRQRPYNVIADPEGAPKAVFISCFDTAPLGGDIGFALAGREEDFQTGVTALGKLTEGKVHLGLGQGRDNAVFESVQGTSLHYFDGPHPAGNVGTQIHFISPINKGETVWTLQPEAVATIGRIFNKGIYDPERMVALTGPEIKNPAYYRSRLGASVAPMLKDNLKQEHVRVISGDVLSGSKISKDGFVGFFDRQISVIAEGDQLEILGWLLPTYPRPSVSGTFFTRLLKPNLKFSVNTNTHGERRAFVATGEYERVTPMDILPMHLVKSILYGDFDQMEGLGIYEVVEEDLALCEFVCPSKQPLQEILREGLDELRAQG